MDLIDTHCHLIDKTNSEIAEILERARKSGVNRVIYIGASQGLASVRHALAVADSFPSVAVSAGVHPHDAGSYTELLELGEIIQDKAIVAIGETGLDFYRDWAPFEEQRRLFRNTIALAKDLKKPLIIHCRDARKECLQILTELGASDIGGVFHCYAEDAAFAKQLADINFLVSFTGNITFRKADMLREAVLHIPLEQMMVETDAPYMAPEPFRGKPSEPAHVRITAEKIAEVKQIPLALVAEKTTSNAERLFKLPPLHTLRHY